MAISLKAQFYKDLEFGQRAEAIVFSYFSAIDDKHTYELVSLKPAYYNMGDIRAIDKETGEEIFIEVKNDSWIHQTRNVVCEEEVYFKKHGHINEGNMYHNNDIYVVVSQEEKKIYVIDMRVLKKIYRNGRYKHFDYPHQWSDCYLVNLDTIEKSGGLITILEY